MIKRKFSLWTLMGIILGTTLFITSIIMSTDNYIIFLSFNSLIMVLGGTIAATMISYQGRYVTKTLFSIVTIIFPYYLSPKSLNQDAMNVIEWAKLSNKKGINAFDAKIQSEKISDPMILYARDLIVSGIKGNKLREMLEDFAETCLNREMIESNILQTMANFSPSFGMVGTLIGLIIMLDNMGSNISNVGPGLALALLTTLYGVIFAQLIFKPASEKIKQTIQILRHRNHILLECLVLLSEGKTSIEIKENINRFINPKFWFNSH